MRRVVMVMHHNVVDDRLRFLNFFSGFVSRGFRVLGLLPFTVQSVALQLSNISCLF